MEDRPTGNEGKQPVRRWSISRAAPILYWVPAIFFASLIFCLSSLGGRSSGGGGRFDFLPLHDINFIDKFYHVALYAFLGAALLAGFRLSIQNCVPRVMKLVEAVHGRVLGGWRSLSPDGLSGTFSLDLTVYILVMIIGISYGISDEIHQTFVPDRSASFTDLLADATGLLLACVIQHLLGRYGRPKATARKKDVKEYRVPSS